MHTTHYIEQPVVTDLTGFDVRSGNLVERLLFNNRLVVVILCLLVTALLGSQVFSLDLNASFEKTIPENHPYIVNYLEHRSELLGLGNAVRIAVENRHGSIYESGYLHRLRQINDAIFLIPGVDRIHMKSLWTPNARWVGVTEEGMEGGPIIPNDYNGSSESLQQLGANVARSGEIGQIVALDATASIIYVPLLETLPDGSELDYADFSGHLEAVRSQYQNDDVVIHITGFAKIIGDLIEGLREVLKFFALAIAIATAIVFWYTRCARSTLLLVISSLMAVVWQLGLIAALGYGLNPYSMLVPFLIFAIGMSHGEQKMNGIMQDIGRGTHRYVAARSLKAERDTQACGVRHPVWAFLDTFTRRHGALAAIGAGLLVAVLGMLGSHHLKIGDLDPGAPELRADSRYNRDVAFMNSHFGASSDVFAVMVETPENGGCAGYEPLRRVDALEWRLRQLEGVESTNSLALLNRRVLTGLNEGNPKWFELIKNQAMLNFITAGAPRGLYNDACDLLTLYVYLSDHKADTLSRVIAEVEGFAAANDTDDIHFKLAAGSAGIEAATNIVVKQAWRQMLYLVYGVVIILCFITFRSWRAVVVAVLPLMLTSILAEALMVVLGIGVKVATLPVIALGVGIGVDYALYILTITLTHMRSGKNLSDAYQGALAFTGKVVLLIALTLAAGVATWGLSSVKFQADMGILLTFMFLLNMIGALVLLPALAHFLLPQKGGS
jgi:predicted RND superfamily exporter protein